MKKLLLLISIVLISACSNMTVSEKKEKRSELDEMAATAIASLTEADAGLDKKITHSLGYAVANMKVTKVPIVGAGGGEGVFVNTKNKKRTYFTVSRFDIGGGWGARSYKVLIIIDAQDVINTFKDGNWEFESGVEASAGTVSADNSSAADNVGFSLHVLSDGGASATATARVIKVKINEALNEKVESTESMVNMY